MPPLTPVSCDLMERYSSSAMLWCCTLKYLLLADPKHNAIHSAFPCSSTLLRGYHSIICLLRESSVHFKHIFKLCYWPESFFFVFLLFVQNLFFLDLTWLNTFRSRWSIGHRLLVSNQFCFVLLLSPPSSSSCTWNLLFTFLSPDLFSRCSLVVLYFSGPAVSTVVSVWQCCHHFFSMYVQASSIFFFLAVLIRVPDQFVSITIY